MKRYLVRAAAGPFDNPDYVEAINENLINGNSGNLLFSNSVTRALMIEDAQVDHIKTNRTFSEEEITEFNEKYDAFVIPLANAFRISFVSELKHLTELVNALDIPCVVASVGYQSEIGDDYGQNTELDDAVRDFVKAVLEKSAIIGLRGEYTASYMEHLGYKRDREFTVVGCPSMFKWGDYLPPVKPLNLTPDSRINVNCKVTLPSKIQDYIWNGVCRDIPDHWYIPQNLYELKMFYAAIPFKYCMKVKIPQSYPGDFSHELYKEDRVRGFVTEQAWLDFLSKGELNFGTRIHGNICGVLAGIPVFIAAPDIRVLELANYHNIPHTTIEELDSSKSIFELLENVDFESVHKGHEERFAHYHDFLKQNGLETIFDHDYEKAPYDIREAGIDFKGPLVPYCSPEHHAKDETLLIWTDVVEKLDEKKKKFKKENDALRAENEELKKDLAHRIYYTGKKVKAKIGRMLK